MIYVIKITETIISIEIYDVHRENFRVEENVDREIIKNFEVEIINNVFVN